MILLLGLWTFVRAMTLGSTAIALENVALRHQLAVLQRSVPTTTVLSMGSGLLGESLSMVAKLESELGDRPARHDHLMAPPGV